MKATEQKFSKKLLKIVAAIGVGIWLWAWFVRGSSDHASGSSGQSAATLAMQMEVARLAAAAQAPTFTVVKQTAEVPHRRTLVVTHQWSEKLYPVGGENFGWRFAGVEYWVSINGHKPVLFPADGVVDVKEPVADVRFCLSDRVTAPAATMVYW